MANINTINTTSQIKRRKNKSKISWQPIVAGLGTALIGGLLANKKQYTKNDSSLKDIQAQNYNNNVPVPINLNVPDVHTIQPVDTIDYTEPVYIQNQQGNISNFSTTQIPQMAKYGGELKKYSTGGNLGVSDLTGILGTGLTMINPVLGKAVSPLLNATGQSIDTQQEENQVVNDHFNQVKTSTNPYGYEKGGELGYEDLIKYDGNSHEEGGIPVGNTGLPSDETTQHEVEGEETAWKVGNKTYIFSNKYRL